MKNDDKYKNNLNSNDNDIKKASLPITETNTNDDGNNDNKKIKNPLIILQDLVFKPYQKPIN